MMTFQLKLSKMLNGMFYSLLNVIKSSLISGIFPSDINFQKSFLYIKEG